MEVKRLERDGDKWLLATNDEQRLYKNVVVATGVNRFPRSPAWADADVFAGQIVHSAKYKNPEPFLNSRTIVVGMGNTGAEIALDLSEKGIETYLSVRGAVNVVPRDLNGRPVQETAKILDKIPFGVGEWIGAKVQGFYFGDLTRYGLKKPEMRPAVQLRTTGKTPVIDIGTIKAIKAGKIKVVGEAVGVSADGINLADGSSLSVDNIILATGYEMGLKPMISGISDFLDPLGYPAGPVGEGAVEGLFFVGFNNYELGGILGTIYKDSEVVAEAIAGRRDDL